MCKINISFKLIFKDVFSIRYKCKNTSHNKNENYSNCITNLLLDKDKNFILFTYLLSRISLNSNKF